MPTVGQKEEVATGWEEPSPESIRRRMEIDDGTAAWGDPGKHSAHYRFRQKELWEAWPKSYEIPGLLMTQHVLKPSS